MAHDDFLPCGRPQVTTEDVEAVVQALNSGWLTNGPAVADFEKCLAKAFECAHAVSCANGTVALHLALLGMGLGPGDSVIVPSLTFLATANAARYVGAYPVFSDVDPETGLMRPEDFEAALARVGGARVRAVLPVHFAGQTVDIEAISDIANRHSIEVIEDGSHAVGTWAEANGKPYPIGACPSSRATTFSFHPVKNITAGEGGAVLTNDSAMAKKMALVRNHAMNRDPEAFELADQAFASDGRQNPWYYEMQVLGFNYRLSDVNAALAESQLKRLDAIVSRRCKLMAAYRDRLNDLSENLDGGIRMLAPVENCQPAWHLCVVLIDFAKFGTSRVDVMAALQARGIGSQVHYLPLHRQPYYRNLAAGERFPGADSYYEKALSLPLFSGMEIEDLNRVTAALRDVLEGHAS